MAVTMTTSSSWGREERVRTVLTQPHLVAEALQPAVDGTEPGLQPCHHLGPQAAP